jgi:hypothetical protein
MLKPNSKAFWEMGKRKEKQFFYQKCLKTLFVVGSYSDKKARAFVSFKRFSA